MSQDEQYADYTKGEGDEQQDIQAHPDRVVHPVVVQEDDRAESSLMNN
jgi:hypothetical protein